MADGDAERRRARRADDSDPTRQLDLWRDMREHDDDATAELPVVDRPQRRRRRVSPALVVAAAAVIAGCAVAVAMPIVTRSSGSGSRVPAAKATAAPTAAPGTREATTGPTASTRSESAAAAKDCAGLAAGPAG